MTGVRMVYDIDLKSMQRAIGYLKDFIDAPLIDEIGEILVSDTQDRFQTSTDPQGRAWKPSQRARDEGGKTLVDFGHLRDSITYNPLLGGQAIEVGSNMVYAAIHQFGGQAGRNKSVKIEARPFLGLSADAAREIDGAIEDQFERILR